MSNFTPEEVKSLEENGNQVWRHRGRPFVSLTRRWWLINFMVDLRARFAIPRMVVTALSAFLPCLMNRECSAVREVYSQRLCEEEVSRQERCCTRESTLSFSLSLLRSPSSCRTPFLTFQLPEPEPLENLVGKNVPALHVGKKAAQGLPPSSLFLHTFSLPVLSIIVSHALDDDWDPFSDMHPSASPPVPSQAPLPSQPQPQPQPQPQASLLDFSSPPSPATLSPQHSTSPILALLLFSSQPPPQLRSPLLLPTNQWIFWISRA